MVSNMNNKELEQELYKDLQALRADLFEQIFAEWGTYTEATLLDEVARLCQQYKAVESFLNSAGLCR